MRPSVGNSINLNMTHFDQQFGKYFGKTKLQHDGELEDLVNIKNIKNIPQSFPF
jgi:hypothetical protein